MDELRPVPRKMQANPSSESSVQPGGLGSVKIPGPVREQTGVQTPGVVDSNRFIPDYEYRHKHYLLRFALNSADLEAVCRLRYEVFNLELGEGLETSVESGIDRDEFDDQCQHLMVIDLRNDEVVGTYRLQTRESADAGLGFYSASEFDLSVMTSEMLDQIVELGRACTSKAHRSRTVLDMLWRGIMIYLNHNRKRYIFGCSSLTSQDPALGLATYEYLVERGHKHPDLDVHPHPGYTCESTEPSQSRVKVPRLFTLYLRLGVKVCGPPAIDRFFGTIDFLTLIDTKTVDQTILANLTK